MVESLIEAGHCGGVLLEAHSQCGAEFDVECGNGGGYGAGEGAGVAARCASGGEGVAVNPGGLRLPCEGGPGDG